MPVPQTRKIATCCYCGARSVLTLDKSRHELSCSACGAPLHEMKFMPVAPHPRNEAPRRAAPDRSVKVRKSARFEPRRYYRKDKRSKSKPLAHKFFEELWDVVEDIFD